MLLNYQDLSTVKKSVEVEIPADLISSEARRVADEFGRHAKIPGFRPGKVPAQVVRTRFAKEIQDEVMSRLLPLTFREAIADRGVEPVGDPHLQHIDAFIEGAPLKYKAEFEVKPHVELGEYRGLEIDDQQIEVTEHDVENMIERLREQASSYRPETERGLEDGDYAMIEITTSADDVEPETRGGHFRLGEEGPMPEMHDALRGKKPGETASFDKTYGEDAASRMLLAKCNRFLAEPPLGQIKTFALRGIKDSPPYLHDGRLFTLEDTVEFFNLVLGVQLTTAEKSDLTAFLRTL